MSKRNTGGRKAQVAAATRGPDRYKTPAHLEIKLDYGPADLAAWEPERDLGYPGEYPFTRGIHPTMYRGRLWTMRQYAGFGSAAESNRRFRYLLEQGQTGLSVAFDLPTQIGYDSDHPQAQGEVGKVGVAIDSLEDMEELLAGIPLDRVSTSMTINATAAVLLALYVAVAKRRGTHPRVLSGTVQNDILKEYIARGTYIYPPEPALRLVTDIFAYCQKELPAWNSISISGYHIREAGATAVQEVAFTLGNALAYLQAAGARGLDLEAIARRVSFFFNAHSNFFEEVAKFRAARRLWARLVRERIGLHDERAQLLRFHAQTAGSTLTAQHPEVNLVRTALEALAAVLGGCQSLHANAQDEALGLPTETAAGLALRSQQVLAHESGVTNTIDPLAGSYFVETLTGELEQRAREYLERIDAMGGMLVAIERGYVQQEIQQAAYEFQQAVERGEQVVVGVNQFTASEPTTVPVLRVDPRIEGMQIERVRALRQRRATGPVRAALEHVEETARSGENLLPVILEAVEAYATVGEISDAMRRVFGEYRESVVV